METIPKVRVQEAKKDQAMAQKNEAHLLGISNNIKRLKDLYLASDAVKTLITIIKISAFSVLLTYLTSLILEVWHLIG